MIINKSIYLFLIDKIDRFIYYIFNLYYNHKDKNIRHLTMSYILFLSFLLNK